jgi:phosphoribosylformimino-5-aminoimidazole carboxamide ribotide isomerase
VSFRVIPVIDLKGGMAVHAIGGRRDQYRPLRSVWQGSPSPIELAAALRSGLGIDCLYLADLDAIEGRRQNREVYQRLTAEGIQLWLDAGVGNLQALEWLRGFPPHDLRVVVGLESVEGPAALGELIERVGPDRVIFSLDMDEGRPRIAPGAEWSIDEPLEIATRAINLGIVSLILLDLARVGTDRGVGTVRLLEQILARYPAIAVGVGGGIKGIDDIHALRQSRASCVLVGSSIHDGRIGRRELERIAQADGEWDAHITPARK